MSDLLHGGMESSLKIVFTWKSFFAENLSDARG